MTVTTQPEVEAQLSLGDGDVVHIVGHVQHWLDRLGAKVPRALCGFLLVADPDRADPMDLGAPDCPKCVRLNGGRGSRG